MKLLLLNAASRWFNSDVAIICERLRAYLVVVFMSTFSLLPVLIRINYANNQQTICAFDLQISRFIVKGRYRSRSENETFPVQCDTSPLLNTNSNLRYTVHLIITVVLVLVNILPIMQTIALSIYFGGFMKTSLDHLTLMNVWLCIGSILIIVSFLNLLKYSLSWSFTCDKFSEPKIQTSRKRAASDCSEEKCATKSMNGSITGTTAKVLPEAPAFSEMEEVSFAIQKPVKPPCAAKSRTSDAQWISSLKDSEVLTLVREGRLKTRELESAVENLPRAVSLRRQELASRLTNPHAIDHIPFGNFDYRPVMGQCCEEVIGYIPIPLGKVGPLLLDGREHYIPLATTEGCLVASTNRGCRALYLSGGVRTALFRDQMTRAPVVAFPSIADVVECIAWIESRQGFETLRSAFNETSSHANLLSIFPNPAGRYLHIRFAARTGEAMGMNMVSKGTDRAIQCLVKKFPKMQVVSLSGNMCTDKKPAAINHFLGRGKSVLAEARLPGRVVSKILRTDAPSLARLTRIKHWTGSAMAGVPGMAGCNAHAANLVAAFFAATGQDLAQVVDSSACLTQLEAESDGSLYVSVTMPCVEVGTVGGGTRLPAQRACIEMLDLSIERPAQHLARLLAGVVVAGELSLLAALATNDLVKAHMRLNRAAAAVAVATAGTPTVERREDNMPTNNALLSPNSGHFAM
ncbi:unnamed protein product [Mesocestoides corti]|nr:unnamed protein product [Mesocestoides corti]